MLELGCDITTGEPVGVGPLTLVPLWAAGPPPATDVLPGSAAIAAGLVDVGELATPTVPALEVTNRAPVPALFVEGEILLGADQDRTLNVDVLVPAGTSLPVPVSCVERGRWGAAVRRKTAVSATHADASLRAAKLASMQAGPETRVRRRSDQARVWADVERRAARHAVTSATDALEDVHRAAAGALDAVGGIRPAPDQVGVAVGDGDRCVAVELFGTPALLAVYFDRLLRGFLLGVPGSVTPRPTAVAADAAAFLARLAATDPHTQPGVGLGVEVHVDSPDLVGAGLFHDGGLVHLAVFDRALATAG